jgi:transposase
MGRYPGNDFYGGSGAARQPDNPRTGVSRACRYDPDPNPTYQEMATYFGVGVVPARPYHRPRHRAKVEVGVQIIERWIVAALRHRQQVHEKLCTAPLTKC